MSFKYSKKCLNDIAKTSKGKPFTDGVNGPEIGIIEDVTVKDDNSLFAKIKIKCKKTGKDIFIGGRIN